MNKNISFNIPYTCKESADNVRSLIENPASVNNNVFLNKCKDWFENQFPNHTAFMTTSCTRALELAVISMNLSSGDEVILSPYTYVGVGNAFAIHSVKLIYVDIDSKTMNINADLIEAAITSKTKAIVAMHYAGIPCPIEKIKSICKKHNLLLIEDNAQGIQNFYKDEALGSFGDFSAFSFDTLKNISCNEGGVLLCKKSFEDAVDVAYNNGTNKTAFSKGKTDRYEWVNKGSKFTMSEYTAAVLFPLLEKSKEITQERKKIWHALFKKILLNEKTKQFIPEKMLEIEHSGHIAYLKFHTEAQRNFVMQFMNEQHIPCTFHYVPLDNSLAGKQFSKSQNICLKSLYESNRLLRLPMHNFLSEDEQSRIVNTLARAITAFNQ